MLVGSVQGDEEEGAAGKPAADFASGGPEAGGWRVAVLGEGAAHQAQGELKRKPAGAKARDEVAGLGVDVDEQEGEARGRGAPGRTEDGIDGVASGAPILGARVKGVDEEVHVDRG